MSETRAGHDDGPHAHVGASKTSDSETVESEIDSKEEGEIWQLYEQVVPKAGDAQSHETTMEAMPTQDAAAHLPEQFNSQPFRFLSSSVSMSTHSFPSRLVACGYRIIALASLTTRYA